MKSELKYAKLVNPETGECEVGLGTDAEYYQSIGMTLQDVCQSNGNWYLTELCPPEIEPDYQQLRLRAYPDYREFLDAQVKINSGNPELVTEGVAQQERYFAACLEVKKRYPKPENNTN